MNLGEAPVEGWAPEIQVSAAVEDRPELATFVERVRAGFVAPAIVFSEPEPVLVAGRHFAILRRDGGLVADSIHTLGQHEWHQLFFGIERSHSYPAFDRPPLIAGNSGLSAYYHWTLETVGAMLMWRLLGEHNDPVIVPTMAENWKANVQRLFAIDNPLIQISRNELAAFDDAVLTNLTGHSYAFSPHPVLLRQFYARTPDLPSSPRFDRIYLSRLTVPDRRRMENEAELCDLLRAYGFTTIDAGALSVVEQAALFRATRIIVAPHGGALTNLVYARDGVDGPRLIELFQDRYLVRCFAKIAQTKRLDYSAIVNPCTEPAGYRHGGRWSCDLELLEATLKRL